MVKQVKYYLFCRLNCVISFAFFLDFDNKQNDYKRTMSKTEIMQVHKNGCDGIEEMMRISIEQQCQDLHIETRVVNSPPFYNVQKSCTKMLQAKGKKSNCGKNTEWTERKRFECMQLNVGQDSTILVLHSDNKYTGQM